MYVEMKMCNINALVKKLNLAWISLATPLF